MEGTSKKRSRSLKYYSNTFKTKEVKKLYANKFKQRAVLAERGVTCSDFTREFADKRGLRGSEYSAQRPCLKGHPVSTEIPYCMSFDSAQCCSSSGSHSPTCKNPRRQTLLSRPRTRSWKNEMESIANSDSVNTSQEDIVLKKVLGGHCSSHVKGKGCGAIPTRSSSSTACYAAQLHNHDECRAKQLETERKLAELLEKYDKLEESQAAMQESQATMMAEIKELKASQAALQAQMDMVLEHLGGMAREEDMQGVVVLKDSNNKK